MLKQTFISFVALAMAGASFCANADHTGVGPGPVVSYEGDFTQSDSYVNPFGQGHLVPMDKWNQYSDGAERIARQALRAMRGPLNPQNPNYRAAVGIATSALFDIKNNNTQFGGYSSFSGKIANLGLVVLHDIDSYVNAFGMRQSLALAYKAYAMESVLQGIIQAAKSLDKGPWGHFHYRRSFSQSTVLDIEKRTTDLLANIVEWTVEKVVDSNTAKPIGSSNFFFVVINALNAFADYELEGNLYGYNNYCAYRAVENVTDYLYDWVPGVEQPALAVETVGAALELASSIRSCNHWQGKKYDFPYHKKMCAQRGFQCEFPNNPGHPH